LSLKKKSAASGRTTTKAAAKSVAKAVTKTKASRTAKPKKQQGAKNRMTAKKTAARQQPAVKSKKATAHVAKKPAQQARKPVNHHAKTASQHTRKPPEQVRKGLEAARKAAEAKKAADSAKRPVEQARRPVEPVRKPAPEQVKKPIELHPVAKKPVVPEVAKKPTNQRQGFKTHEFIVYPSHGVGQIMAIEEQEVAGYKLELFVISFAKDKMTLRVPTTKVASVGMRKLSEPPIVRRALETLKGRARIKRTMWSRRAQEYEAKINSGDIVAIAEVVRDLFRSDTQPEQSYSERQLYEAALDRLAREIAAVERITETEAVKQIEASLAKGPRRGPKPADGAEGEEEAVVEEAEAA
jgi:CarD family transcriptional regulator